MISIIRKKTKSFALLIHELFLKICFIILDASLHKDKQYWCFCAWSDYPHTLDNPRAVFEEVKSDADIYKIILVKTKNRINFSDGVNVKFVDAESLAGIYYVSRSKVILLGYSLRALSSYSSLISNRHDIIQLWHGIPLKKIGLLFPGETHWLKETEKYYATVCSSGRDKEFMRRAFSPIKEKNVWQTGLPRNDIILMDERQLPEDYLTCLHDYKQKLAGRRMVLYAPTWRVDSQDIYVFSEQEIDDLNKVLEENNAVLAVRGHSNVRSHDLTESKLDNTRIIEANSVPDVNILLRLTDVLITDYSSIYIDFMITNKPILYFTYDLESYYKERGFLYDLKEAFASEQVLTFTDLIDRLEQAFKSGIDDVACYHESKQLFHDYDGSSSVAVVKNIQGISNAE